ncbi:hypothetical protein AV530_010666 [Patagioenas fasciata monilis]|uniref:Uncharacterized protein n=1 Tax=Patagioenas fasciata monilis TaxID=372326 RepID=A0A1V4JVJ6_PATFA|nr:hypothetical protein AV530_010666 [Patagioenas fasciata monilis]
MTGRSILMISGVLEVKEPHVVVQQKTRSWQQFSAGPACHRTSELPPSYNICCPLGLLGCLCLRATEEVESQPLGILDHQGRKSGWVFFLSYGAFIHLYPREKV